LRFTRLRVTGFKSFVEPVEIAIAPGLTGVVGPNGCGKSNIMEALRWVMGATSAKAMRAGGMDDVIFSGSATRPARNHAEVLITIDNADRTAPAAFNDSDVIEVSRRITRGAGSLYRINGREARARDVQRLFADASSGANSPALVRQGQINELIAAKPENRRRVLEEAAGVAGLRSRRHEAELKLNAAQTNLERLEDVLGAAERELDHLRRQARQAKRYGKVAAEVRALQAALVGRRAAEARAREDEAATALADSNAAVETITRAAAEAATRAAESAAGLPSARDAEAKVAAALAHVSTLLDAATRERDQLRLDQERAAADQAHAEDERAREEALRVDARAALERLESEIGAHDTAEDPTSTEELARARAEADAALADAQTARDALTSEAASAAAEARALGDRIARASAALPRLEAELARLGRDDGAPAPDAAALEAARASAATAAASLEAARARSKAADDAADAAAAEERAAASAFAAADRATAALDAEIAALERALADDSGDGTGDETGDGAAAGAPVADAFTIEPGYERALAAALGDDLLASLAPDAPMRWAGANAPEQFLPDGVEPLIVHVEAPPALAARLSQIGLVDAADGDRLSVELKPGQRLVARDGALWRWDGFRVAAGVASSAERRLAARAARDAASAKRDAATSTRRDAEAALETAKSAARDALAARDAARQALPAAETEARNAQETLAGLERAAERADAAQTAAARARGELEVQLADERAALAQAEAERAAVAPPDPEAVAAANAALEVARARAAETRAALESVERTAAQRRGRLERARAEAEAWRGRAASADARLAQLAERLQALEARIAALASAPDALDGRIAGLREEKTKAEAARSAAADQVAAAETASLDADKARKAAEAELAAAREARAGLEARRTGLEERRVEAEAALAAAAQGQAEDLGALAEHSVEELEAKLETKTNERDRMGPVNLQAAEEADARDAALAETRRERDDLISAVNKLRAGVRAIDAEARERLRAAFDVIDGHFRDLFQTLFNGGEARLALVDDEDPLVAGLEIYVSPPGKRLGSMSLLSGGEQALTATALIFAVFLANPAPICALDEVDAPLDDANVGRFCDLLDAMRTKADTRFLVITHNPVTMSRVDRLYGVTMAEQGVSQLVTVDLEAAEALAAAS
jgi:chromosome segregation protein